MAKLLESSPPLAGYDEDFHAWSSQQAELLRQRRFDALDIENIAEEIESLGRSDRREIKSRLGVLLRHLLKWQFQPGSRSRSWYASIAGARQGVRDLLAESPSLKRYPAQVLADAYQLARQEAAGDTGLPLRAFPESCPYRIEEVLDDAVLPGPAEPMPQ